MPLRRVRIATTRRSARGSPLLQTTTDWPSRPIGTTNQRKFVELVPGGDQPERHADEGQEWGGVELLVEEDATTDADEQRNDNRPCEPGHMTDGVDLLPAVVVRLVPHGAPPSRLRILSQS